MRGKLTLLLLFMIVFSLPAGSQRSGVFFSLSSSKTFLPGEKVSIRLDGNGVDALEFRVYKVNDPVQFFEKLEDPHSFGHVSPKEQIESPTWLERYHDWKRGLWIELRDFFRNQYSARVRAQIRETEGRAQKSKAGEAAIFAQVPVLNSKQLVARWRQNLPPHFFSESQDVPLNSMPKGVYLVEATNGDLRAYTVVIISDLGLVTKAASGQIVTFAADRRTGAPVANASVLVWSDKKELTKLISDSNGLAESSLPQQKYEDVRVLASRGEDVALVTPYSYSLSSNPDEDWKGYVYTDRPVYRPGHTVHFKMILRMRSGERYKVPAGEQIQVVIQDPTSKQVYQSNLPVSSFGTVHGEMVLLDSAALGYYSISVNTAGSRRYGISGGFYVEEYKKPEYEVKVTPVKPRVLQGESNTATIEAKYYFGEPVAGANVKWVVHTSPYWSPFIDREENEEGSFGAAADEGEGGEGDGGGEAPEADYGGEQVSEQSGKLDSNGKLVIQIPTRIDPHHQDAYYRVEARVTDAGNREISGHSSFIATYGSFQVGISPESYVFQKGDTINAKAVAKDYDGRPVQTALHVELSRPKRGFGGSTEKEEVIDSRNAQTGPDGTSKLAFNATQEGSFILSVSAQTPEKRQVKGDSWIWVAGPEGAWWGGESREIRMVADKKSYKVGDTAHVLIMTGVPDSYLLVTTEARTVQTKKVVHAASQSVTVDVPIQAGNPPNVFLSAVFLHENKIYQSAKNLKVPAVQEALQIEIQPSKPQFQPGEKAKYTLVVKDSAGKPVVGELSLGVVDEAIYAIRPDSAMDIHQYFYGSAYDAVSTDSSLSFYFSGEAGKRQIFLAKGVADRKTRSLAQLKPSETLVEPKIRKEFPDTALWLADVRTDSTGRAVAELTFPDSLTTWRATVRGVTVDTRVGSAINKVIVRKNLMVRLAVPRFFRQGDEVTISAIVHNYLTSSKNVQVSLDLKGLEVLEGSARRLEVPSKADAKVDWRVKAKPVHEAVVLAKALTNEESDAMELTLPVIPFGVKLRDAKSGALVAPDQQEDTIVTLPGNPDQSAPALDITLSPSIAGSIFGALDYLTSYPYGCTEQTMSSFLPNIVVAKALKDLKLSAAVTTPDLQKKIQAGIDRLRDFQHEDGGWGWWKDDESLVFMTAYVVSGFGQAHDAGYDFDPENLKRAEEWLRTMLDKYPNMRPDLRAYVVYALASNSASKPEYLETAWSKRDAMSTQGLAMLGLAMKSAGDETRAREIAAKLESTATVNDREAYWSSAYDYFMEFAIDDDAETTAYAVRLLSVTKPESPLLPKAAFWLVDHRNGGFYWDSTKQTAMVVFGLTEYMKASHELEANFQAEVSVNGKQVMARHFTAADSFNPVQPSVHLGADQLQSGKNEIRIHKSGAGRLYWAAGGSYYSSEKRLFQSNKLSLNITRDYFRLAPEQTNGKIVYRLDPLSGEVQVGDVVAVRVTVGGGEWRYLLVEDPIPAGAEFIQRDDLYELKQRPPWWESFWARREFHDDRAAFFQTYFTGKHEYVYLLKIVNPGKFLVSPAMVQPMYQPTVMATSDAATVEVK